MTDAATRPEHSPLGASSAERWMNCPGSNLILKELTLPETDEPSYRAEGKAIHAAAAHALVNDLEAWELVGFDHEGTKIDPDMADAIGVYLDYVRPLAATHQTFGVEYGVSSPVHPLFYGTCDFWAVAPHIDLKPGATKQTALYVVDLKGGEGIVVDPYQNPQLKYYAFGLFETLRASRSYQLDPDMKVVLVIVQPRAFHTEGVIREWETTVGEIEEWVHETLVPAMARAEMDNTLEAGPWCRFCPAKLACPLLSSLFKAAATHDPKHVVHMTDEMLGMNGTHLEAVKFYSKALSDEILRRGLQGHKMRGIKMIRQKSNRVFTEEGRGLLTVAAAFGAPVVTTPELVSPAGIEKLGALGKKFASEYAYMPDKGLKWVTEDQPGVAVNVEPMAETQAMFVAAVNALEKTNVDT